MAAQARYVRLTRIIKILNRIQYSEFLAFSPVRAVFR